MLPQTIFTFTLLSAVLCAATRSESTENVSSRKFESEDGVYLEVPREDGNRTGRLFSFGVNVNKDVAEGRGKQKKLLQRLLPMFIMPFLLQSAIVPIFLGMLKFMLFKSLLVGKLALTLIALNAFRNHNSHKGRADDIANIHYGYHGNGMEEVGSYFN